jgi:hypothetical protein
MPFVHRANMSPMLTTRLFSMYGAATLCARADKIVLLLKRNFPHDACPEPVWAK